MTHRVDHLPSLVRTVKHTRAGRSARVSRVRWKTANVGSGGQDHVPRRGIHAGLDDVITPTRTAVVARFPKLLDQFDLYAREAAFGRELIDADLRRVPSGAAVLEVGAGSLLLAVGLAVEGFRVAAIEPTDAGFGHMARLGACCLEVAEALGVSIDLVDTIAERYDHVGEPVQVAFAIYVM